MYLRWISLDGCPQAPAQCWNTWAWQSMIMRSSDRRKGDMKARSPPRASPSQEIAMTLPPTVYDPPVRITRASHIVLNVTDLDASCAFYSEVIGLALTSRETDRLYFRGLEEACHHSLVLRKGEGP